MIEKLPWKKRPFWCKIGFHKFMWTEGAFIGTTICTECGVEDDVA